MNESANELFGGDIRLGVHGRYASSLLYLEREVAEPAGLQDCDLSSLLCHTYRAAQQVAQQARARQLKLSYRNIPEQPYRRASMAPTQMNGMPFAMYASQLLSPVVSDRPLRTLASGAHTAWTASLHSVSM